MDSAQNQPKRWQKTQYANLVRYVPSGVYHARAKVAGKLIRESLQTDRISVAQRRLSDLLTREREAAAKRAQVGKGKMPFGDALQMYRERVSGDAGKKPRTKAYYEERISTLLKSWPGLERMDARKISETDCKTWSARFAPSISATAYNHTISILRHILAIAVEVGCRYDNPAVSLKRLAERPKPLSLPTAVLFNQFLSAIENAGGSSSRDCAVLVRFLAYGGFRKSEAANVLWGDVDFERDEITVRGDEETGTKNGEVRRVPMIREMRCLLEQLRANPSTTSESAVMKVNECQKAMDRAAKQVGMKRITHHDLRHLFATRCIESGVDIPTVSRWLGHKDGGALAMRVYGHLRHEHSASMAKRVTFSTPDSTNVVPMPETKVA
jgi:integrase